MAAFRYDDLIMDDGGKELGIVIDLHVTSSLQSRGDVTVVRWTIQLVPAVAANLS